MADTLTVSSRTFYERTKAKFTWSLAAAAGAIFLLALCSMAGGLSAAATEENEMDNQDDHTLNASEALANGYGFAAFFFIIGVLVLCVGSLYISPMLGSSNEKKMFSSPQELEGGYSSYTEASAPPSGSTIV